MFYTRLFESFPMMAVVPQQLDCGDDHHGSHASHQYLGRIPAGAGMRFRGRKILLLIILSTFLLPGEILLVPLFLGMIKFKLANTYFSIAVPASGKRLRHLFDDAILPDHPGRTGGSRSIRWLQAAWACSGASSSR